MERTLTLQDKEIEEYDMLKNKFEKELEKIEKNHTCEKCSINIFGNLGNLLILTFAVIANAFLIYNAFNDNINDFNIALSLIMNLVLTGQLFYKTLS